MSKPIKLARVELDDHGVRDPARETSNFERRSVFTSPDYTLTLVDNRLSIQDSKTKRAVLVPWVRVREAYEEVVDAKA